MTVNECFIFIGRVLAVYWICRIFLSIFLDEEKHPILAMSIQAGEVIWGLLR